MTTTADWERQRDPARFTMALSDEQLELREAVRSFAQDRLAPGAAERDRSREFPHDLVREMAEMGLMAVKVPADEGGAGADNVAYALVMDSLARCDASCAVVMAASNLCANILTKAASPAQKERWLRPLAEGALGAAAFCLTEPQAGSDASQVQTVARPDGAGFRLSGSKMWATSGAYAGLYLVFAKTDPSLGARGLSCFVVEKGAQGLEIGKEEQKMGQRSSGTVALHLDGCYVERDAQIGAGGEGYGLALEALGAGRVGIAALACGLAEAAMLEGVRYSSERRAFGQRVADFQASQFALAECLTELDAAWLLTLRAARLLDQGDVARAETSMAKMFATEACGRIVDRMLQLHGGYGYSEEYPIERLYRDARVTRIYEGTNEIQRLVVARELLRGLGL
ncbi:MAG: acyl-CoA dehydrogenase family protein [Planctomycetota bacterium]